MKILRRHGSYGFLYDTETLKFSVVSGPPWPARDRDIDAAPSDQDDVPSAPIRVYLEITRRCNLTCGHCFVSASPTGALGLNGRDWITLMHEMQRMGVIDLRFTGGEVTTRKDWHDILKAAKELGFAVSLNTNGVFDDTASVTALLAELNLEQVTLSLDGLRESHDRIRGIGNFAKTYSALLALRSAGVRTRVNCVLTTDNVSDVPELLDLVAPHVDEVNFFYMRPVGRARGIADKMLDFDRYLQSAVRTLACADQHPNVRIMHREQAIKERSFYDPSQPRPNQEHIHLPSCVTTMNISADGKFWPHGYNTYQSRELSFGQFPNSLSLAWARAPQIQEFRKWQSALLARCKACSLFTKECPGSNIEMEIAAQLGVVEHNPYCTSEVPAPTLSLLQDRRATRLRRHPIRL